MTDLLDAFALIALAADEPAAPDVERVIRGGRAALTATNLSEVVDVLMRLEGRSLEQLQATLPTLVGGVVGVIDIDAKIGWRAGELRARHYHRQRSPLSLADCHLLAAAAPGDAIVTADRPLARAAEREGVEALLLSGGSGDRA